LKRSDIADQGWQVVTLGSLRVRSVDLVVIVAVLAS